MQMTQLIYSAGSLALIIYLVRKAENKWFLSAILLWLFSIPILENPNYTISLPIIGIDLQPSRILFLFLLGVFIISFSQTITTGRKLLNFSAHRFQAFEFLMIGYVGSALLSMVINLEELGLQVVIVNLQKLLTFLLVYFFASECISSRDFRLLAASIVIFGLLSVFVGIYQFAGDPNFFRIGEVRSAFGSYFRGNGLFSAEYDQGIFLTFVLIIGMTTFKKNWIRVLMIVLLPLGVFFTMHRASWVIFSINFVLILLREMRNRYLWIFSGGVCAVLLLFAILNTPLTVNSKYSVSFWDELIKDRVMADTLDTRMNYNRFAMGMIQKYPLGIGDYVSNVYAEQAYTKSLDFSWGSPLIVHNGFLSAGVRYGVLGMILFSLFLVTSIYTFLKYYTRYGNHWYSPLMIMLVFLAANFTNDFSFLGTHIGLYLALLIGAYISASGSRYVGEIHIQPAVYHRLTERMVNHGN